MPGATATAPAGSATTGRIMLNPRGGRYCLAAVMSALLSMPSV